MTTSQRKTRANYFADEQTASAVGKSVATLLASIQKAIVAKYLSPENTHRLRHGDQWSHPGLSHVVDGDLEEHSSFGEIRFDDIVMHDLSVIERFAQALAQDMERQFAHMMYSTVFQACDRTENVVDAKAAGSTLEGFAEMIEKIQFSADRSGEVRLPEIHAGPEAAAKFKKAFEEAPPAYLERMEEIKARKIAEAIDREAQRKARFVRYGDNA